MKQKWLLRVARWVFAFFFIVPGVLRIIHSGTPMPFRQPEAQALNAAVHASGFLDPLMAVALIIAGLLLLFHRTAPLGLVTFAPLIIVFALFHIILNQVPWMAAIYLAYFVGLVWVYRKAFAPLWNHGSAT